MTTLSPTESDIQVVLRAFLLNILPAGTEVFGGQWNRVPEPAAENFVVSTTIRRERIETNLDGYADVLFQGNIAGPTLTVVDVAYGTIAVGSPVFGVGVAPGTVVTALGTGSGGIGSYTVAPSQNVGTVTLSAGTVQMTQPTQITVQLDVHSNDVGTAADMAQTISTAFRDAYAVDFFTALNPAIAPLYADDPRQAPFTNAEMQLETRYIVEAKIQANQTIGLPQQFAGSLNIDLVEVEAAYPPI